MTVTQAMATAEKSSSASMTKFSIVREIPGGIDSGPFRAEANTLAVVDSVDSVLSTSLDMVEGLDSIPLIG